MFLGRTLDTRTRLLLRLTVLYAGLLTLSFSLAFFVFYYRVHSLAMERMDMELLEEVEEYSAVMADEGFKGIIAKIAEEAKYEDPDEAFCRLIGFDGKVFAATDMSCWGYIDGYGTVARTRNNEAGHAFKTLTIGERQCKARIISAVIGFNAVLQIGETLDDAEDYLKIFRNSFFMLMILVVFLSAISGWLLAKKALLDMEAVYPRK